ncbi:MAG: hypothetical protein HC820_02055 [Hydrococcus sp. RM1_1_31]|nr:hypothetical protein [Hydrococcus sp. RM1_1_31]
MGSVNDLQLHITQLKEHKRSLLKSEEAVEDEIIISSDENSNIVKETSPQWEEWDELLDSI